MILSLSIGCAAAATPAPSPTPTPEPVARVKVVTTTTILADLARNVGGELVEVVAIVPPGGDVHSFQTTPSHSVAIGDANVIVSNGLGLDDFLDPLLSNNRQANTVHVVASQGLSPEVVEEMEFPEEHEEDEHHEHTITEEVDEIIHQAEEGEITPEEAMERMLRLWGDHEQQEGDSHGEVYGIPEDESLEEGLRSLAREAEEGHLTPESALEAMEQLMQQSSVGEHHEEDDHGHEHGAGDPHFWQDPLLAVHYVEGIRDGLIRVDPERTQVYTSNAEEYIQKLQALDQEIAQTLGQVPPEHRHLVTFHDAFGYFGRRYGWQVSAFVPSDASDVTPEAVIRVMERIKMEGIPAVFAEPQFSPDVLEQAARDTGVQVGTIYSDTVDDTVPSYLEMMRFNAQSLAENLR